MPHVCLFLLENKLDYYLFAFELAENKTHSNRIEKKSKVRAGRVYSVEMRLLSERKTIKYSERN